MLHEVRMFDEPVWKRWATKRHVTIAATALVAAIVLVWIAVAPSASSSKNARGRPPTTVGTAKVVVADVPVTLPAIGTVVPIVTATVRTQLAGQLMALHFTEGQMVKQGDLLAEIDPRPYRLALAQAQANLAKDTATANQAKVDLARDETLLAEDSIARQDVETEAATQKQAQATVDADGAAVNIAKLNLDYTAIVAPVTGRIGLRQADIGNYLTPSDPNGIAVITQVTPLDVTFALPQSQLALVQQKIANDADMAVTANNQWDTAVLAQGRFLTLDNQIDPTTGTVKAKARFDNPAGKLFPGLFVNVVVDVDTLHDVATVPISAVRHGVDGDFVFVLQDDDTVAAQHVETGPQTANRVAILSGVAADATVISEGADSLDDGSRVRLSASANDAATRVVADHATAKRSAAASTQSAGTANQSAAASTQSAAPANQSTAAANQSATEANPSATEAIPSTAPTNRSTAPASLSAVTSNPSAATVTQSVDAPSVESAQPSAEADAGEPPPSSDEGRPLPTDDTAQSVDAPSSNDTTKPHRARPRHYAAGAS
jgi:multidrug efflux system membrane fusion protein